MTTPSLLLDLPATLTAYDGFPQKAETRGARLELAKEIKSVLKQALHDKEKGLLKAFRTHDLTLTSAGYGSQPLFSVGSDRPWSLGRDCWTLTYPPEEENENPFLKAKKSRRDTAAKEALDLLRAVLLWTRHLLHRRPQLPLFVKEGLIEDVLLPLLRADHTARGLHQLDRPRIEETTSLSSIWLFFVTCALPLPGDIRDRSLLCDEEAPSVLLDTSAAIHYRSTIWDTFLEKVICRHADLNQALLMLLARTCDGRQRFMQHSNTNGDPFFGRDVLQRLSESLESPWEATHPLPLTCFLGDESSPGRLWPLLLHPWATLPHSIVLARLLSFLVIAPLPAKNYQECLDDVRMETEKASTAGADQAEDDIDESSDLGEDVDDLQTFFVLSNKDELKSEKVYRRIYAALWLKFLAQNFGMKERISMAEEGSNPHLGALKKDDCYAILDLIPDRCLPYLNSPLSLGGFFARICRNRGSPELAMTCLESYFQLITQYRLSESFAGEDENTDNEQENASSGYFETLLNLVTPNMFYQGAGTNMQELLKKSIQSPALPKAMLQRFLIKLAQLSLAMVSTDSEWIMVLIGNTVVKHYAVLYPMLVGTDVELQSLAELAEDSGEAVADLTTPQGVPVIDRLNITKALVPLAFHAQQQNDTVRDTAKRLREFDLAIYQAQQERKKTLVDRINDGEIKL